MCIWESVKIRILIWEGRFRTSNQLAGEADAPGLWTVLRGEWFAEK